MLVFEPKVSSVIRTDAAPTPQAPAPDGPLPPETLERVHRFWMAHRRAAGHGRTQR